MDDAFDTFRNQRVRAHDAPAGSFHGRYICPVCQTEVLHASGFLVAPYFRHHPGTEHEECERYCRTFYSDVPLARHEAEHIDAALVARLLTDHNRTSVAFAVRYRAHGDVKSIDFISGQLSTPYKIHHSLRQQYFPITRPEEHYTIKARLAGGSDEHHVIQGFDNAAAVFRLSEKEAVRLASHRVLRPGAYIIVTRKIIAHAFHPGLQASTISTITDLQAVRIEIPEDPNWQIRENIRTLLGFETSATLAWYTFLTPQVLSELATDSWEISTADRIACYLRLSKHLTGERRLLIQQRRRGHLSVQYFPLGNDSTDFTLEIASADDVDLYRIGIATDSPKFLFEIRRTSEKISPVPARLLFHFKKGERNVRVYWSSHHLVKLLKLVKRREWQLASIKLPRLVEIGISDCRGARERVVGENAGERLTEFLHRSRYPIVLQANGYPAITLLSDTARIASLTSMVSGPRVVIRSRSDARLAAAFRRNRTSSYSIVRLR